MLTRSRVSIFAALVFAALACSKGSTGPDEGIPAAEFSLQTLNGFPLPLPVSIQNGVRLEIVSGTFKIESSYEFTNSATYRRTEHGLSTTSTENCVGTYAVTSTSGASRSLTFLEFGGDNPQCGVALSGSGGHNRTYTGTWDGANRLTIDFDETTRSVYTR